VLGSWARAIIRGLDARGVDGRSLATEAGIDLAALDHPEARYPITATARLWRLAVERTGDPCFGLCVSRYVNHATFHALGAAVVASSSLREAFGRVARYSALVSDAAAFRLEEAADRWRLVLAIAPGRWRPADESLDALLSLQLRVARAMRQTRDFSPLRVILQRPEPTPSQPFEQFFRAPIVFSGAINALEFSAAELDARLPTGNAELARRIDEVLDRYLEQLGDQQVVSRARAAVIARFPDGEPAQETIARALGMSSRTLQRRLAAEGTTYQALVEKTREDLARSYLAAGWSVTAVAFTLGFADTSSFSRAFRRWTGKSPSDYGTRG
jgi:AraC-like DNA-binding protein